MDAVASSLGSQGPFTRDMGEARFSGLGFSKSHVYILYNYITPI